jgi:hypothetical protein
MPPCSLKNFPLTAESDRYRSGQESRGPQLPAITRHSCDDLLPDPYLQAGQKH